MTAKSSPKSKATNKKRSTAKRTQNSKKTTAKASVASKAVGLRPESESFMTFRVNRQTVYWAVLGLVVVMFTIWILKLQSDIQAIYDQIDTANASAESLDAMIEVEKSKEAKKD